MNEIGTKLVVGTTLVNQCAGGRIGRAAAEKTAVRLSVSAATLYHLIKQFRKERRVSAFLPGKRGRPTGTRAIPDAVEAIIQESIRDIYLVPERPPMKELARQVATRCRGRGAQPPTARTVKARVDRIDPQLRARLRQDEAVEAHRREWDIIGNPTKG